MDYLLGEFLECFFVEDIMSWWLKGDFSDESLELCIIWWPILFLDVDKEVLQVVQLNEAEEVKQKRVNSGYASIKFNLPLLIVIDFFLYPVHLWAFPLIDFHF